MSKERTFADGFIFKRREDAPEFVIGSISVKVEEAVAFLKKNEKKGWVNLEVKKGRTGNPYIELNTYEGKSEAKAPAEKQESTEKDVELPF